MTAVASATVIEAFHLWYYNSDVWTRTTFLGIPCAKSVLDMWNYQEIIVSLRPSLIVEFGTWRGGSALFFSTMLGLASPHSKVLTVDVNGAQIDPRVRADPHIELLECSSTDPRVASRISELRQAYAGLVFVNIDSDHRIDHVLGELKLLRTVLRPGDYVVLEDTNINGHPVLPGWGAGPMEALGAYEREFPNDYVHDVEREQKFGFSFAPGGFLVRR